MLARYMRHERHSNIYMRKKELPDGGAGGNIPLHGRVHIHGCITLTSRWHRKVEEVGACGFLEAR